MVWLAAKGVRLTVRKVIHIRATISIVVRTEPADVKPAYSKPNAGTAESFAIMASRPFDKDRDPWERQKGEGTRSYALFTEYLRLKPSERRLRSFAEAQEVSLGSVQGLHSKWRWGDRIGSYEAEIDRQTLKATGEYNKAAASDLAAVMTKVPEAARKALEIGVKTLDRYMSDETLFDEEGNPVSTRLHARDAVQLLAAANNLMAGLTRYLEGVSQLTRSLNIQVSGRVEHALAAPEAAELMSFIGALEESRQIAPGRREILEAHVVSVLGDPLALDRGDEFDGVGDADEALSLGGEDQPLPLEAES